MSGSSANRRTGRPKRIQLPSHSFPPLPAAAQPQPVELACLVYRYLLPLYPQTAQSLLHEAADSLPALAALKQQRCAQLAAIVSDWLQLQQRQWDERRLVALLDGLEQRQTDDERKEDGGVDEGGGLLQRTVVGVMQLLADYNTARRQQEKVSQPPDSSPTKRSSNLPPPHSTLTPVRFPLDRRSSLSLSIALIVRSALPGLVVGRCVVFCVVVCSLCLPLVRPGKSSCFPTHLHLPLCRQLPCPLSPVLL